MVPTDSGKRFSDRVDYYFRYRPRYPREVITFLEKNCGLTSTSIVVDVGSGTGFLSELFLKLGNPVYGVEPNREMRLAGEEYLRGYPGFHSIEGTAESTKLQDGFCDFVTAGQAFHWFDIPRTRLEFRRILKDAGRAVLLWNERATDTPFLKDYENFLLEFGTDYREVDHRKIGDAELTAFFGTSAYLSHTFHFKQLAAYQALEGRLLSCSYIPLPGNAGFEPMIEKLRVLHRKHATDGNVEFEYCTQLYVSPIVK